MLREWALLLPAYSIILCILTWWTYWALAITSTPSFSDLRTMSGTSAHITHNGISLRMINLSLDSHTRIPKSDAYGLRADPKAGGNPYAARLAPNAIPELCDVPVGLINRLELGKRQRPKSRT